MGATAAIVAGGGAVLGGILNSNAASGAASAQEAAANNATQTQWNMFQQQQQNQAPWRQAGQQALSDLQSQMPDLTRQFTSADFQQDPGYQFNLQQGQQALQRSAAARGLLNSTGTMKGIADYSQGLASNEFQNAYNRFTQNQNQRYNMLSNIAGLGQTANGQLANVGMNAANNIGEAQIGAGNAAAAGAIGQGNAMSGMVGGIGNGMMNYSMMNRLFPSGGGLDPSGTVRNAQTFSYEDTPMAGESDLNAGALG